VVIGGGALPAGTVGSAYSSTVQATGGTPPYVYTINSGALPAGLTLLSSGIISGTPTTAGVASIDGGWLLSEYILQNLLTALFPSFTTSCELKVHCRRHDETEDDRNEQPADNRDRQWLEHLRTGAERKS
jgi:hypothetical protein